MMWLMLKPIVVLVLRATIFVTDVMSTSRQDVIELILVWWFMMLKNQIVFDRYVTRTKMYGCLFKL